MFRLFSLIFVPASSNSIGVCLPNFVEHSSEKLIRIDGLVLSLVSWYRFAFESNFAKKAKIFFLTLSLLVSPLVTTVNMYHDYNKIITLKHEMLMKNRKLNTKPESLQGTDLKISAQSAEPKQHSSGQNII